MHAIPLAALAILFVGMTSLVDRARRQRRLAMSGQTCRPTLQPREPSPDLDAEIESEELTRHESELKAGEFDMQG